METAEIIRPTQTPTDLLAIAIEKNLDIDKLERLMAMKERYDKEQARKAYFEALAEFQFACPELRKTKGVRFKDNEPDKYMYAPLADIDRQIKGLLKDHGLTKTWKFYDSNGKTKVACIITHVQGHSETTDMEADSDMSGAKNAIQGKGSSIEYMKRYTLIGALGLTTADMDIDGRFMEKSVDELHAEYMKEYSAVIQLDPSLTKWDPDNWEVDRTAKNYAKAVASIRKVLFKLQNKGK